MKLTEFVSTDIFDKRWLEIGLSDEDLRQLQNFIMTNPLAGNVIQGIGGVIKLRYSLPNKGKSGGVRVIFVNFVIYEKVYLITCYPKSAKDNLTESEKASIKTFIKRILDIERRNFYGR